MADVTEPQKPRSPAWTLVLAGILLLFLGLLALGFALWVSSLLQTSYPDFTLSLLENTGKLHKLEFFRDNLLPPARYFQLHYLALASALTLLAAWGFLVWRFRGLTRWLQRQFGPVAQAITASWVHFRAQSWGQQLILALAVLGAFVFRLYGACTYPISYDEAWTYLNFVRNGWLVALSWYPAPNNHLLYSLLATASDAVLPGNPDLALRLPALLVSLLLLPLLALAWLRRYSFAASIMLLCVVGYSPFLIYYGYSARGYGLTLACFAAGWFLLDPLRRKPQWRGGWLLFGLAGIVGGFAIPSYAYGYGLLASWLGISLLIQGNWKGVRALLLNMLVVGGITALLYVPALAMNGLNKLIGNPYVTLKGDFPTYLQALYNLGNSFEYLFSEFNLVYLAATCLLVLLLSGRWRGQALRILYFVLFGPFVLLTLQGVYPPERTWLYLAIPYAELFVLGLLTLGKVLGRLANLASLVLKPLLVVLLLGWAGFWLNQYPDWLRSHEFRHYHTAQFFFKFLEDSDWEIALVDSEFDEIVLDYYYTTRLPHRSFEPIRPYYPGNPEPSSLAGEQVATLNKFNPTYQVTWTQVDTIHQGVTILLVQPLPPQIEEAEQH